HPTSTLFPYTTLFRSNARSLAKMYASLIREVDGVRLFTDATVRAATERQSDETPDKVMGTPVHWGLGFQVSAASGAMLTPSSFGDRKSTRLNSSHVAI